MIAERTSEVDPMLPLTLGRLLEEERQRQIESTLLRRRWLERDEPETRPQGQTNGAATSRAVQALTRPQGTGAADTVCPSS